MSEKLKAIREADHDNSWDRIKKMITEIQGKDIGNIKANKKEKWMTDEMLEMMERRRTAKGKPEEYRKIKQSVQNAEKPRKIIGG